MKKTEILQSFIPIYGLYYLFKNKINNFKKLANYNIGILILNGLFHGIFIGIIISLL